MKSAPYVVKQASKSSQFHPRRFFDDHTLRPLFGSATLEQRRKAVEETKVDADK